MADMRFRIVVYFFLRVFKGKEELLWEGDRSSNPSTGKTDFYLYRRKKMFFHLPNDAFQSPAVVITGGGVREWKGFWPIPFFMHRLLRKGERLQHKSAGEEEGGL